MSKNPQYVEAGLLKFGGVGRDFTGLYLNLEILARISKKEEGVVYYSY